MHGFTYGLLRYGTSTVRYLERANDIIIIADHKDPPVPPPSHALSFEIRYPVSTMATINIGINGFGRIGR